MDEKQVQNSDTTASALFPAPEPTLTAPEPVSVPPASVSESKTLETVQTETPVIEATPASMQAPEVMSIFVDEKPSGQPTVDTSQIPTEDQPISDVKETPVTPITSESLEPIQPTSSAPAPLTPQELQPQSLAQQDQRGFIRSLLVKAQAKIQFNKQKKLDKIIQFAQKKQIITNDDVQKLLRVSDATATRYLVRLVGQGRLARAGNPRDAKYQFLR